MGKVSWKQAVADYDQKKAGSNTASSSGWRGSVSWADAIAEYDRYNEEEYKTIGQQRIAKRQQEETQRLERNSVVDWMDRYNRIMEGVSAYDKQRNGGFTRDASGGFDGRIESLIADYEGIKGFADRYGLQDSRKYLDQLKQLQTDIDQINERFSQFNDEEEYGRYQEYLKDLDEKRNLDLDAYSRGIAELEQQLEDYDPQIDWTNPTERKQYDAGLKKLEDEISRRKQYLAQAQRIQKKDEFSAVTNPESEKYDAAFDSKSGYVSTERDGKLQRMLSQYSMGYDDLTYEYINNQNGIRDEIKHKASAYSKGETPFEAKGYDYMTEDEVGLYNYYYSMGGKKSAEAYLDTIQEDLNQRKAAGMYQQMEGKTGAEMVFGVEAGLDQFKGGIKGAVRAIKGDDSYVAPSATQYASGMVREDLADDGFKLPSWLGGASLGQVGYDAITTTANMAPSIAVGMLNPTLGTAALGVSAGGTAYQEALNEGYSVDQARGYGILSGASEIVMEKVLGGISAYGGNALGKFFTQNMKNADTALKRIAKELGGSMLSEFSEEYLQEVLTPVFRNLTLGTDEEVKLVSAEALYAGFLGAITGGVMEGPQAIANSGNAMRATSNTTPVLDNATPALEKSTPGGVTGKDVASAEESSAVDDKMSATEVGAENATTTKTPGTVSKMENIQMTEDLESFAQQFGSQADAVRDNYVQGQDLQAYEAGFHVAFALGMDGGNMETLKKSVPYLSQRQQETAYNLGRAAADNVNGGVDNTNAGIDNGNTHVDTPNTTAVAKAAAVDTEVAAEESADTGSAVQVSTGRTVEIARIASVDQKGGMTLELNDGTIVDAGDIQHPSEGEAVLYEAVAAIGADAEVSNILVNNWKNDPGGVSAEQYTAGMIDAFNYGRYHVPQQELADNKAIKALTPVQRNSAYALGRSFGGQLVQTQEANARRVNAIARAQSAIKASAQKKLASISGNKTTTKAASTSRVNFDRKGRKLNAVQESSLQLMEMLAQATGTKFHVYESYVKDGKRVYKDATGKEKAAPNGWYETGTGEIHIDLNAGLTAEGTMLYTTAHELTHFIREWSPAKFDKLAEAVFELVYKENNISVIGLIREQQAKALRTGREISFDEAYEEVVADSVESILTSGNVVEFMAQVKQKDQTLWEKIREWFKNLAEDIRKMVKAYSGHKPDSPEGRVVAAMKEILPVLEGFYAEALQEASENFQAAGGQKNTAQEGGRKYQARSSAYDYSKPFSQQVDDWINGTFPESDTLLVGGTPSVLTGIGFPSLPITIAQVNLKANINGQYRGTPPEILDHLISSGDFKRLPELLADPVAIIADRRLQHNKWTVSEHVVDVLVEMEINGKQTLVPIKIDGKGMQHGATIDTLSISSIHGNRDAYDRLEYALTHDSNDQILAFYVDKNKATAVLRKAGYTITGWPNSNNGFIHSITDSNSPVKLRITSQTETRQFKKWFRGSKVVNSDGTPKEMYHGTSNSGFTVFNTYGGNFGLFGKGSYFTDNPEVADSYTRKGKGQEPGVYGVYLSIKNPLDMDAHADPNAWKKAFENADLDPSYLDGVVTNEDAFRQLKENLADEEYLRWEAEDLVTELIEGMGYDGITHIGGGRYGSKDGPKHRVYIAFEPEQIKSSDENIGTFDSQNPDIRYSYRDPLQEKAAQSLEKENEKLREDVKGLKELVKLQGKLTGGKVMKPSSVEAAARHLKKSADAKGDTQELAQLLTDFYSYISGSPDLTWEGVKEAAQKAADWLWENRREVVDEYSAEILQDLRTRNISLSDSQKAEAAVTYDTFGNYRKSLFGSVKITGDGLALDEAWQELSGLYPGVFDENMNANDMPAALADIVSRLKNNKNMAAAYDQDMMRQSLIRDVYDSYWNVSTLHTVADVKQKEINALKSRHAQRMTDLRTKHREKVAELRQEQRDAVAAVRTAEREKAAARTKKALDKYQNNQKQVAANRAERKGKTELRRKIRKTVFELDRLLNRGNKKKNVKDGMSSMVGSVLKLADALFMDEYTNRDMLRNGVGVELTDEEEKLFREAQQILQQTESGAAIEGMEFTSEVDAMEQLKKLDQKLSSKMAGLKDVFARERKRLYGTTVSDLLGKLAAEYSRLSEAEDGAVRAAKDENVYAHLLQLQKDVSGTTVRDMSLSQLEQVADAFTMVLTTVRNANKMFARNLQFKRDTLSNMVMAEIGAAAHKISKLVRPGKNLKDSFSWNNLKPVYAFERLGSQTLKTLFGNIRKGQDVWAVDMQEADAFRREQYRKYGWKKWDAEKLHSFTFASGKVELNLGQIMSLYAYSRREAALDHLLKGGFVFGSSTEVIVRKNGIKRRFLKKDATAYNLTADELLQVTSKLTKEQKAFVEEMQTYLSDVMGSKGNEVSLQMYGIRSFGEKNYFPLRSAGQYMEKAKEDSFKKEQGQISIVNSGFTKAITPHASNPITLDGFMDVWAEHVNDMAMYHGFVLPMEDFRRVYNYSSPNVEAGNSKSVNAAIENAFGAAATGYIDQLYKDLNGGAVSDNRETIGKKLVGLHKKAAVFASWSVVVQQPSAFVRAFALVDPGHFIGPKVDKQRHKQLWAELKQYAPVALVKEMGYFDTGMGKSAKDYLQAEEYSGIREKMAAIFADGDYRDEVLGKAPALADEYTWCTIWEAVKRETRARNPGMNGKSDAFLKIAGERFAEVIDKTQVYDSVLSRSANMRSKSLHMNMLASFMAEPTTSINMLEDALRKGDRKHLKRTVGAVYGSVLLNSLLVSLVYAARDDDEDETWWEKYLSSVAVEMLDGLNPITYYPFLKDIWSIGQGFDVERSDMSLITDFADAAKKVVGGIQAVTSAEKGEEEAALLQLKDSLWGMVDSIASLTGLPAKNIRRDIEAARNVIDTISKDRAGRMTTKQSLKDAVLADVMNAIPIGGLLYEKSKRDRLYGAIVAKDKAYVERLKEGYETDAAYHSAIKLALRDHDSRIWEAAAAWNADDLKGYMALAREIIAEGNFIQDDVVLAIRAEASSMEESQSAGSSTVKGYFTNEKFGVAMGQNNTAMADIIRRDMIDTKVANGKTYDEAESSVESTARSQLKELFAAGSISASAAEKMLVKYGGYEQDDAAEKVSEWKYEADHPELDGRITFSQYQRWEADGKSRGISLDTYTDVVEFRGGDTSSGVRSQEEVAAYINAMPISTAQKDALWCCFWSESTLYKKAPWH